MEHEHSDINAALAEIEIARANLSATGAVDCEVDQLSAIEGDLRRGSISSDQAINAVRRLLENRNGDH